MTKWICPKCAAERETIAVSVMCSNCFIGMIEENKTIKTEEPETTSKKLSKLYNKNGIEIYNGDCLKVMQKLIDQGIKVDTIITDPPYKLTSQGSSNRMGGMLRKTSYQKGDLFIGLPKIEEWLPLCFNLLKDGTHIYIMTNDKNLGDYLSAIKKSKFKFIKTLIWVKPNKITGRWYMTQKETIIMARKGTARPINNAGDSDIITTPNFKKLKTKNEKNQNINFHDTEKPVSLNEIFVLNSTNENQICLDPFAGIGSLAIAAAKNNRKAIGIEISKEYCNIAIKRLEGESDVIK